MGGFYIAGLLLIASVGLSAAQTKIWSLAIGHEWGAHDYIDTDGYHRGFGYDIVDRVCTEGGMDCRMIWDKYSNCWMTDKLVHPAAGRGLMSRWYDGCMGWVPTIERIHTLSFTYPYLEETTSAFFFLKGNSFDPSDLQGKKIAILDGWASNEKCIARQGKIRNSLLKAEQLVVVPNPTDVLKLLKDNQVQAVFGADDNWTPEQRDKLAVTQNRYKCFLGGNGVLARKDSALIAAWNVGFSKLKDSNGYSKFCKEFSDKHSDKGAIACNIS